MKRKIEHKVGVKILSKSQLENVLPTYPNLFHKIDICRKVAKEEMQSKEKRHYQYNFMYDNVFSILGKRGTGKTSVVFTLREMIREKYGKTFNDVVLPLVIPEVIPDNCTVLGWLLAIVKEEVKEMEGRIKKLERANEEEVYQSKCKYMNREGMLESLPNRLDMLSQLFYAGNYNPSNEISYYRAVDNSVLQSVDYYRFAQEIASFWDAWIQRLCELHKLEEKDNDSDNKSEEMICPLIYFIFDDVDLAPEKIDEILSVIIKYLSHPNIIVLTTADEELFLEATEKRLDKNIGRLPREWREYLSSNQDRRYRMWVPREEDEDRKTEEDLISQTARMYLGKVLPTSTRYYLRLFQTAKQKEAFCLEDEESLGNGVSRQVQQLIDSIKWDEKPNNFMKQDNIIANFYLKFMGNTSRQIGNVYIALQELVKNLIDIVRREKKEKGSTQSSLSAIYQYCRYFLCVAIRANHKLAEVIKQIDDFIDEIFLPEYNQWKMYYNYAYLNEFLEKNLHKYGKPDRLEIALQLYALLAFQENLLLLMEGGIRGGITCRKKIHVVRSLAKYVEHEAFEERHVFRNDMEPINFFYHYSNLLDKLVIIVKDELSDIKFNMQYFYEFSTYKYDPSVGINDLVSINRNNHPWFRELVGMLSMVYGNAYLFDRQDMKKCIVYDTRYLLGYQRSINADVVRKLNICFGQIKMQSEWKKDKFQEIINKIPVKTELYYLVECVQTSLIGNIDRPRGLEQGYALLGEVIETVSEIINKFLKENKSILDYCSQGIIQYIISEKEEIEDRKGKERLIQEYIREMKKIVNRIGREAYLFDEDNLIKILLRLGKKGHYWNEQGEKIINGLHENAKNKQPKFFINKDLYFEIIQLLNYAVESGIIADNETFDNDTFENDSFQYYVVGKNEVEEIFANMDIIISLHDKEELSTAVELGMQMLIVEFFQRAYIYQTIYERYESNSDLSSKTLEKIVKDGEKMDTYYNYLFRLIVDICENKKELKMGKGNPIRDNELNEIRKEIVTACQKERRRYVDMLTKVDENE